MKPTLNSLLQNTKSILIVLPKNPYFDQVAAATALSLALEGKYENSVYSVSPMLVEFNRLVNVDKITNKFGNKNLVIKLKDNYPASNVERVLYDTDGATELVLTVVPKPGMTPPSAENFNFETNGVAADTVILIGGSNETHFPILEDKDFLNVSLIHIGRESIALQNREVMSLARPASTISELVGSILKESDISLNGDGATNLLMGITEGSRNFVGPDVTSDTFRIVADLLDRGGKRAPAPVAAVEPRNTAPQAAGAVSRPATQSPGQPAPKSWLEPKIFKGTTVS